jgi:F-type H+-transporting ATPase subunit delta
VSLPQIARRYARALHETARETGQLAEVERDLAWLSGLLLDLPEVLAWCRAGHSHAAAALPFVRTAFLPSVGTLTARTLLAAAEHGRLEVVPLLPAAFEAASVAAGGPVRIRLETAHTPEPELLSRLSNSWALRTGRPVVFTAAVVPELVGGFRLLWNDRLLDRSARGRLRALRSRLTAEAWS